MFMAIYNSYYVGVILGIITTIDEMYVIMLNIEEKVAQQSFISGLPFSIPHQH